MTITERRDIRNRTKKWPIRTPKRLERASNYLKKELKYRTLTLKDRLIKANKLVQNPNLSESQQKMYRLIAKSLENRLEIFTGQNKLRSLEGLKNEEKNRQILMQKIKTQKKIEQQYKQMKENKNEFIQKNMGLIYFVIDTKLNTVKRWAKVHGQMNDIVQEGYMGLNKAIDTFKPEKDVLFGSYATKVIHDEILNYYQENVFPVQNSFHLYYKINNLKEALKFINQNKRYPSENELSNIKKANYKLYRIFKKIMKQNKTVDRAIAHIRKEIYEYNKLYKPRSLNEKIRAGHELTNHELGDVLNLNKFLNKPYEESTTKMDLKVFANYILKLPNERDKKILIEWFKGKTLKEISFEQKDLFKDKREISRERVNQIKNRALGRLYDILIRNHFYGKKEPPLPKKEFIKAISKIHEFSLLQEIIKEKEKRI